MSARLYKFLMIFFYQLPVKEVQMFLKLHTLKVIKIIFNFRSNSLMVSETFDLRNSVNLLTSCPIFYLWQRLGKAYLAQSPQLYKQMVLCADFDRVFTIGSGKTTKLWTFLCALHFPFQLSWSWVKVLYSNLKFSALRTATHTGTWQSLLALISRWLSMNTTMRSVGMKY